MKTYSISLLLLILVSSCNLDTKPEDFDYGHIENGKYVNAYFNFSMDVPANWYVLSKKEMDELTSRGVKKLSEDNWKLKAVEKVSEINTANLFSAFRYKTGTNTEFNSNLMIIAENLSMSRFD